MERPKGSRTDEQMKKCEILPSATMERHLEDIMLSEINQTERQILHDLTCEILNKTNQTFIVTEEKDGWLGAKGRYGSKDTNLQL